jgi:hypothetical protein
VTGPSTKAEHQVGALAPVIAAAIGVEHQLGALAPGAADRAPGRSAMRYALKEMRAQLANRALTMPPTEPAPTATSTIAPAAAAATPSNEPSQLEVSSERNQRQAPTGTDWLGWGMAGTGLAAMAGAGALFVSSLHLDGQANVEPDTRLRNQLHDQAGTRSTLGIVVGIGGFGLTTAGIIKLVLHTRETPRLGTVTLDVGITGNGAFVVGSF